MRRNVVLIAVAVHSLMLGAAMLAVPATVIELFRLPSSPSLFFPRQAGAFLVILGIFYARAVTNAAYVPLLIVSKAIAVVFLFASYVMAYSEPAILLAGVGDLAMLVAILVVK